MEARFAEKLKQINSIRSKVLDTLYKHVPQRILVNTSVFHSVVLTATVLIVLSIFSATRSLTLFSLHPICMVIGTFIFLAEGLVSFKNDSLLEAFSPIMQHSKKAKVRAIHQSMQITGSAFILFGTLIIVANKVEFRKSIIPHSIHSILGLFVVIFMCGQAVVGQQKYDQIDMSTNVKTRRWHGDAGLLLWDLLCLTILTGLTGFLTLTFSAFVVEVSVLLTWFGVHAQMTGGTSSASTPSNNSGGFGASSDGVSLNSDPEIQQLIHREQQSQGEDFDNTD